MAHFICSTCGTQYAESTQPPPSCPVCEDDRQYVGWEGQRWTTADELRATHEVRVAMDDGVLGLDLQPTFAIPQRVAYLPTASVKVLWESLSVVTDAAVEALQRAGGVDLIALSHPHFYSSMVDWSRALGGVPVLVHAADREWVRRPAPCVRYWDGDELQLGPGVSLLRLGGHFPGSTGLYWADAARPRGALFPGDALQVGMDRRTLSFMYSYPNHFPMAPADVVAIAARLEGRPFEQVYGYSRGRNIVTGGRARVDESIARFLARLAGQALPGRGPAQTG